MLYLIDGSSQMYRAYHAPVRTAEGGLLRNAQGTPTNAVYIFVNMLRKLLNEHKPEFIAASFDLPGRTFRDDLVDDYKANRAPMPSELAQQIPMVHAACEALGVPILTSERYEADDVIGTLAVKAAAAGFDVAIVTMDKDFFQLVGGGIRVYNPRDEGTWYDADGVKEKFGVAPDHVVDVLALMGDTIDNIKGVPGVGEKGARDLIVQYGSLENLLAHASEVKNKRYREGLLANMEPARQSRELARIRTDVPVEFHAEELRYRAGSREAAFAIFNELGFRALAKEYAPTADTIAKTYRIVNTADGVRALAERLRAAGRFAFRVLPDGPTAMRAAIVGMSFSTSARDGDYVPIGHRSLDNTESLPLDIALGALRPLLEDEDDRQGRARPQIRRDRARASRRHPAGPRPRHDAGELPAGCDPLGPPRRGSRARAHELQGAVDRGRLRARSEGDLARRRPGGRGGRVRLRARRPGRPARAHHARPARQRNS